MLLSYSNAGVQNMELIAVITLLVLAVDVKGNPQLGSLHRQDYNDSIYVPEDGENLLDAGARYALSLLSAEERQSIIDECTHALDLLENGGEIVKRSVQGGGNSNTCCSTTPTTITSVRARVVTKVVQRGVRYACGFMGYAQCIPIYLPTFNATITTTEYYEEYITIVEDNFCPEANIVCCSGYVYYPTLRKCLRGATSISCLHLLSSHYINMKIIAAITFVVLVVGVKSLPQLDFPHTQDYNESIPVPGDNETLLSWETENALSLLSADEKQSMIDECLRALDKLKGNGISKRSIYWGGNFCCDRTYTVSTTRRHRVVRARTITRTVYSSRSYRCGLFGIRRCHSRSSSVVTTTEYYAEYTYIEVTSYLRCSSANLVCCSGYVYHPWSGQCVSFIQLENDLDLGRRYEDDLWMLRNL
ncbi:hypothetical protein EB796_014538 [Bugula neritina]|uniref:Uncharacterized protein n=1 Tax=Bugula neritina TaxID=10212 RepID=A0A7J7JNI6_BUGNE|nr:hypothetical protein EB796_014538 [Bugula neritina]